MRLGRTFVWAAGTMKVGENERINTSENRENPEMDVQTSISEYMDYCFRVSAQESDDTIFWFHNLKFDGYFIAYHLLVDLGYCVSEDPKSKTLNSVYAMVSSTGEWYKMRVINSQGTVVLFQNSLRKLPFKAKEIAESLKLERLKGKIDYKLWRPEGGSLSKIDYDYLYNDVWIIKVAMEEMFYQNGLTKLTIGSDCMAEYKKRFGKNFDATFPKLDKETDAEIRKSYKGGYCYKNPKYHVVKAKGFTFDYNSMYPSVMHSSSGYLFPYGQPVKFTGCYEEDLDHPLYIQRMVCEFKLKEGFIPTIQIKGSRFRETEYLTESNGIVELSLTNIDLVRFYEHYDVWGEEFLDGYKFKGKRGMFDSYIEHWFKIKQESDDDPVMRQLAKLFLNNLYGKFASSLIAPVKVFSGIDKNGGITMIEVENENDGIYLPVGVFCTAYARKELQDAIMDNIEIFIYCDTDSIHCFGNPDNVKLHRIHNTDLGAWKLEGIWDEAIFIRQKTYMEHVWKYNKEEKIWEWKWDIKCAGMPEEMKAFVTPENFKQGLHIPAGNGKLRPTRVAGGILLVDVDFTMN